MTDDDGADVDAEESAAENEPSDDAAAATDPASEPATTDAPLGDVAVDERSTAPQSEYGPAAVAIGALIAIVGLAIAFGLPLLAA